MVVDFNADQTAKPENSVTNILPGSGETLAQAAYRALREDIIRGVRYPNERLRIEKLKSLYNVGPTPLREALQMLAADRLVVAEGNRGFSVAPLDFDEFEDLNTARTAVEVSALRLSLVNGDATWEAGVVASIYLMQKQDAQLTEAREGVPDAWEEANAGFHDALVAACGSRWLLKARADLNSQCTRFRRAAVYQRIGKRNFEAEHKAIADAALARNVERTCELTEKHFALTAASLRDAARLQLANA